MTSQRRKNLALYTTAAILLLLLTWWTLRKIDPTSSAIFISDSPDGKFRCAVFNHGSDLLGTSEYEAALFAASWPHHELPGSRAQWSHESVSSTDFSTTWHPNGADLNFKNGLGDNRETLSGKISAGSQNWSEP